MQTLLVKTMIQVLQTHVSCKHHTFFHNHVCDFLSGAVSVVYTSHSPVGPIMATRCPGLKYREMPSSITLIFSCSFLCLSSVIIFFTILPTSESVAVNGSTLGRAVISLSFDLLLLKWS